MACQKIQPTTNPQTKKIYALNNNMHCGECNVAFISIWLCEALHITEFERMINSDLIYTIMTENRKFK
jgi:hypothetical protein